MLMKRFFMVQDQERDNSANSSAVAESLKPLLASSAS